MRRRDVHHRITLRNLGHDSFSLAAGRIAAPRIPRHDRPRLSHRRDRPEPRQRRRADGAAGRERLRSSGGACTPAPAPTCSITYERATATGRAAVEADPTAAFTDYTGDEINAVPPVTEYLAEHVLVVGTPDDESVMVALIHDGSVVWRNAARHEDWTKLRRGAIGHSS
jgi:hypothetical protein